jgi:hypothetical protein
MVCEILFSNLYLDLIEFEINYNYKINKLGTNSKKNITDSSGMNKFKSYQPRTNLVEDENASLFVDSLNVLN